MNEADRLQRERFAGIVDFGDFGVCGHEIR